MGKDVFWVCYNGLQQSGRTMGIYWLSLVYGFTFHFIINRIYQLSSFKQELNKRDNKFHLLTIFALETINLSKIS